MDRCGLSLHLLATSWAVVRLGMLPRARPSRRDRRLPFRRKEGAKKADYLAMLPDAYTARVAELVHAV